MEPAVNKHRGRPRGQGERYASGRLKPDGASPVKVRKLFDLAMAHAVDPRWAEPLGMMLARQEVTDSEYEAGALYARLKRECSEACGTPPATPRSASLQAGSGRSPDAVESPDDVWASRKLRRRYARAREAVEKLLGGAAILDVIERVCCELGEPSWTEKLFLKPGLKSLAEHFGISAKNGY